MVQYFKGVQLFPGGGGGVEMLICIETNRTCDFPLGGGVGPLSSLWIRTMIRVVTKIFRLLHSK